MKIGDLVRTKEGFEDTVLPGYEGIVAAMEWDAEREGVEKLTLQITKLPDGYEVPEWQTIEMMTFAGKVELIEDLDRGA